MNLDEHKTVMRRMQLLIAFAAVIVGLYVFRLIFLQLVNGDSFKARATNTTDYHFTVTAARGDIVDSEGKRIAASTTNYNVVLSKLLMGGGSKTARAGTTPSSSASRMPTATTRLRLRRTAPATRRALPT